MANLVHCVYGESLRSGGIVIIGNGPLPICLPEGEYEIESGHLIRPTDWNDELFDLVEWPVAVRPEDEVLKPKWAEGPTSSGFMSGNRYWLRVTAEASRPVSVTEMWEAWLNVHGDEEWKGWRHLRSTSHAPDHFHVPDGSGGVDHGYFVTKVTKYDGFDVVDLIGAMFNGSDTLWGPNMGFLKEGDSVSIDG